jgi:excinuclease ABC subunit B
MSFQVSTMKDPFKLEAKFSLKGDQPEAVDKLVKGINNNAKAQTLLGITGSGKTFTIANVIAKVNRPTLVISHNKTLAAQLYSELRSFFPHNAVEYFVSYYDYYLPESYKPETDTYIEKDTAVNENIEKLRYAATGALMSRRDVIIVSSVSCIYGLGMSLEDYQAMHLVLNEGDTISRDHLISRLVDMQYKRTRSHVETGTFRLMGEVLELQPPGEDINLRIELDGDRVDRLALIDHVSGEVLKVKDMLYIYPARHFATPPDKIEGALKTIKEELDEKLAILNKQKKIVEAYRLETRTNHDIEMIQEMGYCKGIENYSRHFTGRKEGQPPYTLMDYFPKDYLLIVDESHVTLPQVRGMYKGDHSRKKTLIDYGFRLDSAQDNRPLQFDEFYERINSVVFMSATPSDFEIEHSDQVVEQILRPTGLLDPKIEIRPTKHQIDDLLAEVHATIDRGNRVLVTTLTKKMAEDLTEYLQDKDIRARYLHSEIDTLDRIEVLRGLKNGEFDVLVGINLLREGLDMPVVELVAILDADKEGFLRSETSLIQTIGRASRNEMGRVIMYADKMTRSMKAAIDITTKRRRKQERYNKEKGIVPKTITSTGELMTTGVKPEATREGMSVAVAKDLLIDMERDMRFAAQRQDFELAAKYRDELKSLREWLSSQDL